MQLRPTYRQDESSAPLISFIVTDFNIPVEMLSECLDSIFALSLSDSEREVILVDDGSDISPLNSILNYIDKIVYIRQPNQGVSEARNIGLKLAKGKFVQFVDGDDCFLSTAYEHVLDIVRYKNTDMVLFNLSTNKNDDLKDNGVMQFDGPVDGAEYMRHNNLRATPCGYVFSHKLLGSLTFTKGIEFAEDEEFTPQLILRAEDVYYTDAPAYYYRQWKNSTTHKTDNRRKLKRLNDTIEVICSLRNRADVLPYEDRTALQRRIDQLTMDYIYNVIKLTHNGHYLEKCIARLRERGLFPLPKRDYTKKYSYFRQLVNTKIGRKFLLLTIR